MVLKYFSLASCFTIADYLVIVVVVSFKLGMKFKEDR
jgi:hypothetical protein